MSTFDDSDSLFNAIATIFAVTVLLDQRERDIELVEFTHACMVQNHRIRPSKIISRQQILAWFAHHRETILGRLSADEDDRYKLGLLGRIHDPELQRSVLSSIFTISVADYELHDEESAFINQALRVWKTQMPTPVEIDAVA